MGWVHSVLSVMHLFFCIGAVACLAAWCLGTRAVEQSGLTKNALELAHLIVGGDVPAQRRFPLLYPGSPERHPTARRQCRGLHT